jgi:hypothetical protein
MELAGKEKVEVGFSRGVYILSSLGGSPVAFCLLLLSVDFSSH